MSKNSPLHPAMAERIALEYVRRYNSIGYAAASDYVEQVIGENPLHISQVREIVVRMLHPMKEK